MQRPLFIFLCFLSLSSCAQLKTRAVKKANAYYRLVSPGAVYVKHRREEGGNLADTVYFVYLQGGGDMPTWSKAWRNRRSFKVTSTEVTEIPVNVGVDDATSQNILLAPAAGAKLYRLTFQKESNYTLPPGKIKNGVLFLQGKDGDKTVQYGIDKFVRLQTIWTQ